MDKQEADSSTHQSELNLSLSSQDILRRQRCQPVLQRQTPRFRPGNPSVSLVSQKLLRMNMTLKEIVELIRAHLPSIRTKQRFVLSRVHSGEEGRIVKKELGTVMVHKKGEAGDE